MQLATEGRTYQEIADELGYANRGTVHHIVHDALTRDRKDAVENHQQLELARLDARRPRSGTRRWPATSRQPGCVATWRHIDALLDERLLRMVPHLPDQPTHPVDGGLVHG
jgi:hypothetical protein